MQLLGPAVYDKAMATPVLRSTMQRATQYFMVRGRFLLDVMGDGNCVLYCISPCFDAFLGRPTFADELRMLLVVCLRLNPMFAPELNRELKNEIAARKLPADATIEDLLAKFSVPNSFLPPILVAMATFWYTHKSVHVYGVSDAARNEEPALLYDENGPADLIMLYSERQQHVFRVVLHPQQ